MKINLRDTLVKYITLRVLNFLDGNEIFPACRPEDNL